MFLAHEAGNGPDALVGLFVLAAIVSMSLLWKLVMRGILALFLDFAAMRKKHSD